MVSTPSKVFNVASYTLYEWSYQKISVRQMVFDVFDGIFTSVKLILNQSVFQNIGGLETLPCQPPAQRLYLSV